MRGSDIETRQLTLLILTAFQISTVFHINTGIVQDVHKVSLRFQKFITKARLLFMGLCVYRTKVRDITNLKQRITDAIATIDESMLQRTWQEIECRLDVLRATNGAHIEVY
jgi:hypothetical protein